MAQNFKHVSHIKSSLPREVVEGEFYGLTPTADESSPVKINIAKRPTADKLINGEIAVNYLKGHETLTIKNTEDEIVGFVNENEFYDAQEIIAGAMTQEKEERTADISRLEGKFGDVEEIQNDVAELEYVVSSSLNDLNSRINKKETSDEEFKEKLNEKELVIASALNDLNSRISDSSEQVEDLATSVDERFERLGENINDIELVISSSLNDLNSRISDSSEQVEDLATSVDERINDIELVVSSSLNDLNNRIKDLDSVNEEVSALKATIKALSNVISKGHDYVDLGLPSGTLWAKMNVGASSETDYGNYYMYGMGSKTYDSTDTPYAGTENPLAISADTAAQVWGGMWHTPTRAQILELVNNTTFEWVTNFNGTNVNGGKFTASNGNYVFFPATGYYSGDDIEGATPGVFSGEGSGTSIWSSTTGSGNDVYTYNINDGENFSEWYGRSQGNSVRPVIG